MYLFGHNLTCNHLSIQSVIDPAASLCTKVNGDPLSLGGKYLISGVEASALYSPRVRSGQGAVRRGGDDLEGGAEGVESSGGQLGGAGGELQQTGQLFLSEAGHHGPEPLHHLPDRETVTLRRPGALLLPVTLLHFLATDLLPEVPRASDNNSVGLEVLNVDVAGATH